MEKAELTERLKAELNEWSRKTYHSLATELQDVVVYQRGEEASRYQVEVLMYEHTPEYVHVGLMLDAGGWRQFIPLSTSFLVYRDGRVDRPEISSGAGAG
jgi:hypothetical protein